MWYDEPAVRDVPLPLQVMEVRASIFLREDEELTRSSGTLLEYRKLHNAWMDALGITVPAEQVRINERIVERVRLLEAWARKKREKLNKRTIGKERLLAQPLIASTCHKIDMP